VHRRNISAVRRVEFVSDRMSYIILRGRWCNIIVVNVHAPCEDTSDDINDSLCEELGRVFDQFPRYDMEILLGDFKLKAEMNAVSAGQKELKNDMKSEISAVKNDIENSISAVKGEISAVKNELREESVPFRRE
jgi:hypothetical protein